jgi:hypothetical protein
MKFGKEFGLDNGRSPTVPCVASIAKAARKHQDESFASSPAAWKRTVPSKNTTTNTFDLETIY